MRFCIKTFENLLKPGVNSMVPEVSPEERKALYGALNAYGISQSTAYTRIFRGGYGSGFDEWELRGIRGVIADFEQSAGRPCPAEHDMPRFYLETLEGRRKEFCDYLQGLGMSYVTVIYRFKNWNFKEWELKGIRSIVEEICSKDIV